MFYIFIDLEMNFVMNKESKLKKETIQIGAIKCDENFNIIEKFDKLIKPSSNEIVENITSLTGISNEDVTNCRDFNFIMKEFLDFCGENYKIIAWSSNDYMQLKKESKIKEFDDDRIKYMFKHWEDLQRQICRILEINNGRHISLDTALNITNIKFDGKRHNAYDDARCMINLYKISRDKKDFKEKFKDKIVISI